MSVKERAGTRAWPNPPHRAQHALAAARVRGGDRDADRIITCVAGPGLHPIDDPNAVVNGEIVYTGFTAYEAALDHAVDAWSPARGFAVAFREATPAGDAVPEDANLIYRDVEIPGSAFKV